MQNRTLSLLELTRMVTALVQRPETQNVWVTAELSDVAVRGGHCYMELVDKDDDGRTVRYFDVEADGWRSFKVENFVTAY